MGFFLKVSYCDCKKYCQEICEARYYAATHEIETSLPFNVSYSEESSEDITFIHKCENDLEDLIPIEISALKSVCFYVKINSANTSYIIEPVHKVDKE